MDETRPSPTASRLITKRVSPASEQAWSGVGNDGPVEHGGGCEGELVGEVGTDDPRPVGGDLDDFAETAGDVEKAT